MTKGGHKNTKFQHVNEKLNFTTKASNKNTNQACKR